MQGYLWLCSRRKVFGGFFTIIIVITAAVVVLQPFRRLLATMEEQDVVLLKKGNASVSVHLHGATILSWEVDGHDNLFLSEKAVFDGKKAIRGGIPFIFPCFGPWSAGPQHGFARNKRWNVKQIPKELPNGDVEAKFYLEDSHESRMIWDYAFKIVYTVTLKDAALDMHLDVTNKGDTPFTFTVLLHTYFRVSDVTACTVSGMKGCAFIDKTKGGAVLNEDRDLVTISEFTDRVYTKTPNLHIITGLINGRKIKIVKEGFPDTVVWNPWEANAKAMSDFGDDEYRNMLCVEAGHVGSEVVLQPQHTFHAAQSLRMDKEQ